MAFIRSLFSGVSGLRNHQTMMDVIGNNISNVNTIGFKSGRATFKELFAQTLRGASRPVGDGGGTNPMQVGLGMSMNTLDTLFTQGNVETTGNMTDLAILGSAFFIVKKEGQTLYSRDGRFDVDAEGKLVNPGSGAILQGKMADVTGNIPPGTALENIVIDRGIKARAQQTTNIRWAGNLDASEAPYAAGPPATGGTSTSSISVFDSLGNRIALTLQFTKTADNAWGFQARIADPPPATTTTVVGSGAITFNTDGSLQTISGNTLTFPSPMGGDAMNITLDFGVPAAAPPGGFSGLTQTAGSSTVIPREQDGYAAGPLSDLSIDQEGRVLGTFTNGTVLVMAQVMLADFNNPAGLLRSGENNYTMSGNSGMPAIIEAATTSKIVAGSLEQSNVDLAEEFTKMISAQRGFQANARVVTASDEFLQEVVNLKR